MKQHCSCSCLPQDPEPPEAAQMELTPQPLQGWPLPHAEQDCVPESKLKPDAHAVITSRTISSEPGLEPNYVFGVGNPLNFYSFGSCPKCQLMSCTCAAAWQAIVLDCRSVLTAGATPAIWNGPNEVCSTASAKLATGAGGACTINRPEALCARCRQKQRQVPKHMSSVQPCWPA